MTLNNKRVESQEAHCSRIQIAICNIRQRVRHKLAQFSRKNRESTKNANAQTAINTYIDVVRLPQRATERNDDKSQFTPAIFQQ